MKLKIFIPFLIALLVFCCNKKEDITETKSIDLELIFEFEHLTPNFDFRSSVAFPILNKFAYDRDDNFYFLDIPNHRIMKYSFMGEFLNQIGSIGQGEQGLFFPFGIFINQDKIYILDNEGKELKIYSLSGDYISSFEVSKNFGSRSLCVSDDYIFVNNPREKADSLVSIYSKSGEIIRSFGEIIETNDSFSNSVFNSVYMCVSSGSLFGGFRTLPTIFRYDMKGKKVFQKEIRNITEVDLIADEAKKRHVNTPQTKTSSNKLTTMTYCVGFSVVDNSMLYALDYDRARYGVILKFNQMGSIERRIFPEFAGNPVRIESMICESNGDCFLIIRLKQLFYLVRLNVIGV